LLAVTASLAALAAAVPNPCHDPSLALRCPDLVMAPASHLRVARSPTGRRVLRMENRIVNVGAGPAELFGQRTSTTEMHARQVIANAARQRRRFETGAELYFKSVPSRGGSYWKFQNAARFELWSLDAAAHRAQVVRVGPKHDYCLRDLRRVRFTANVRRHRFFGHCNQRAAKREVTLGTSVGWADIYPSTYPDNWIDVTGLRGCFAIVQHVDPGNHIFEIDEGNNVSSRIVRLPFRHGPQRCPRPAPVPPAPPAPTPPPAPPPSA
jgi:Lysyl oxidase